MSRTDDHPSSEPWRLACPEGHRNLVRGTAGHYCDSCGQRYPASEIWDVKHEVPPEVQQCR